MNKIRNLTIIALIIVAAITYVLNIFITNSTALDSITASKIQTQIDALAERNVELKDEVLAQSSYQSIASKAADLGFSDSRDIVSVYDPVKVAIR